MSFDDMMKNLRINYLKDLQTRLHSLSEFNGQIETKHEELRTFFHQLKGSGATYGVPSISEIGKTYEEKVKSKTFCEEDLNTSKTKLEEILKDQLS